MKSKRFMCKCFTREGSQYVRVYDSNSGYEFVGYLFSRLLEDVAVVDWGSRQGTQGSLYRAYFCLETGKIIEEETKPSLTRLLDESEITQYKAGQKIRVHYWNRVVEGVIDDVKIHQSGIVQRILAIADDGEVLETLPYCVSMPRPDLKK